MITRRELLRSTIAGAGASALAPGWFAAQQDPAAGPASPERILVVVQMTGGNDGLNTIVPYADDRYHAARPTLRIAPDKVLKLDDHVGFHPSLELLRARYDKGQVAVIQGVGYPGPNRSHFRSMDIWHGADPVGPPRTGWLGRYADSAPEGSDTGKLLVHLGPSVPLALRREHVPIIALDNEDSFALTPDRKYPGDRTEQDRAFRRLCTSDAPPDGGPASYADRVRETAASGLARADEVRAVLGRSANQASYPRNLGPRLALAARLIAGGLGARVYYASFGSFDTHARQRDTHAGLLQNLAESLEAFLQDLAKLERERDVAVLVFSEFGRRVAENGSAGTDHGAAAPVFVVGPAVQGGLYGPAPDLEHLEDGDLSFALDFRAVYATLLKNWLGAPLEPVVPGDFAPLSFLPVA